MKKILVSIVCAVFAIGCASSNQYRIANSSDGYEYFELVLASSDSTYGRTEQNPIKIGGAEERTGPRNTRLFFNALLDSNGEPVEYSRTSTCCQFQTENSPTGFGLLDVYTIKSRSDSVAKEMYVNIYESDTLRIPVGFRAR